MKPNNGFCLYYALGFVPQRQPATKSSFMSDIVFMTCFELYKVQNRYYIYFNETAVVLRKS